MKKLAVCLHLYYLEQTPEVITYLRALDGVSYDLFVTMVQEDAAVREKILTEHPSAEIWVMENRGYDIGPFIEFLHRIDLSNYEYVLKLHTKGRASKNHTFLNGIRLDNALWGKMMWESLLGEPSRLRQNLEILDNRAEVGMLGSRYCVTDAKQDYEKLLPEINDVLRKMGLSEAHELSFVAGAMFMVRASVLEPLLAYGLTDFEPTDGRVKEGTLAHVMERVFGVLVTASGYKIEKIQYKRYLLHRIAVRMKRFIMQKKTTKSGKKILKICKIPVCQTSEAVLSEIKREFPVHPLVKKRLAIYAAYDAEGIVDKADIYYLEALQDVADNIIYVADNELILKEAEKISGKTCYVLAQKHGEYDFGSYKRGFFYAKEHGLLNGIDELILCNDSCYAPVHPFGPVFDKMREADCDFWGITENTEFSRHLQSYFMVFRPQVFHSKVFADFLNTVKAQDSVFDVIQKYEIGLSAALLEADRSYLSYIRYPECYPVFLEGAKNLTACPIWMINQGAPVVKKKSFTEKLSNEEGFFRLKRTVKKINPALARIISLKSVYGLIWRNCEAKVMRFFWQKKLTRSGKILIKVCKIPVYCK